MIPQTKGRGRVVNTAFYRPDDIRSKQKNAARYAGENGFRPTGVRARQKKKCVYPRRGFGQEIEKGNRKRRAEHKRQNASGKARPPPAAAAATLPKPINCTLSAKKIAFRVFNTSIRLPLRFVPIRHPHIYYNKSFPFGQAFFDVFLFAARQFR